MQISNLFQDTRFMSILIYNYEPNIYDVNKFRFFGQACKIQINKYYMIFSGLMRERERERAKY